MSRIGKIARLPHDIREQLNVRLRDGHSGPEIIQWVNELPQCRQMLAQKFGGRPIDEGNLYEWRHGGYEEWLWNEDRRDQLQSAFEHVAKLDAIGDGSKVAEQLGAIVAAELTRALNFLEGISDMNDRWCRLREISRELTRFRRENCNNQRLRLAEQRLENETERQRNRQPLQQDRSGFTSQGGRFRVDFARRRGATKEHIRKESVTEEQRSVRAKDTENAPPGLNSAKSD